jgi:hypothetical protein
MKTARFSVCNKTQKPQRRHRARESMNESPLHLDLDISASYRTRNVQACA